jgi:murein DD-endopeptidase MepM/ murein hydrolase activator NlpD
LSDVTAAAPVSSKFGWRRDPLTGEATFHNGVDIAVAYGRDVKAAAGGVVSFAGVQHGYGNTLVIDHEDGRQTRYAHLSQELVRVGDVVREGQIVAKSGNSGRSTGPHLHFEMLVNGRPVDPVTAE